MDEGFDTRQLPGAPDAVAPDGSDVRVLLRLGRGSMAHLRDPQALTRQLTELGWHATVTRSDPDWLRGEARPALRP